MKKRRIFKAFVASGFANTGRTFGFASQKERDEFVKTYEGARTRGFVDVTPAQFREWQETGHWADMIEGYRTLLRHGIDNDWTLERR